MELTDARKRAEPAGSIPQRSTNGLFSAMHHRDSNSLEARLNQPLARAGEGNDPYRSFALPLVSLSLQALCFS